MKKLNHRYFLYVNFYFISLQIDNNTVRQVIKRGTISGVTVMWGE